MPDKSGVSDQIISLPQGGGELKGLGEKFQPDLHTGTGRYTIPIAIPSGRNGFQPQLSLDYSVGSPNGPFGIGWTLDIPSIYRKTSQGMPKYNDIFENAELAWNPNEDIFVLSGSDDLIYVGNGLYRPRIEGLFARIQKVKSLDGKFYWAVTYKNGIQNIYGKTADSRVFTNEDGNTKIYKWFLSETIDTFGNKIVYSYKRDIRPDLYSNNETNNTNTLNEAYHDYNQLYLQTIEYVNFRELNSTAVEDQYLWKVEFDYGEFVEHGDDDSNDNDNICNCDNRPDSFSNYIAGFEIRTASRCKHILIKRRLEGSSSGEKDYELIKSYDLNYSQDEFSNSSLLKEVVLKGHGNGETESFPPISFEYTKFEPDKQKYESFSADHNAFPESSLVNPNFEIVDLFGDGLPSVVNSTNNGWRYWRNLGNWHNSGYLKFASPLTMKYTRADAVLSDGGVQFADLNGDGSVELLVTTDNHSGFYIKDNCIGNWTKFIPFNRPPSFNLKEPEVRLVDLDGDGVVDVLATLDDHFLFIRNRNSRDGLSFDESVIIKRVHDLAQWPDLSFGDPGQSVRLADMSGDGLQDIVYVNSGRIDYWPNLGYGKFGKRITMSNSPIFPEGFDPNRLFIADVNGDGLADIVYDNFGRLQIWINQCGNSWSKERVLKNTPIVINARSIRVADMAGTGSSGILWSYDYSEEKPKNYQYLDLTGGKKPLLLNSVDNNIGARTIIEYKPSTHYYQEDQKNGLIWKTTPPFPIQVVASVQVIDRISHGKITSEYMYHHGYWDGKERDFLGFGRVDQRDTETFKDFHNLDSSSDDSFEKVPAEFFSPPTEIRNWFHQGPVGDDYDGWNETDLSDEYWQDDYQVLLRPKSFTDFINELSPTVKRDALRSLRGRLLRTELYALDGDKRQDRPYSVSEYLHRTSQLPTRDASLVTSEKLGRNVFFPCTLAERTSQWERGNEPMTQFKFIDDYDEYGQPRSQTSIAVPRRQEGAFSPSDLGGAAIEPYLVTHAITTYAKRDDADKYIVDRVAQVTAYEIKNDGTTSVFDLRDAIEANRIKTTNIVLDSPVMGQTLNFYDGPAFQGLPFGQIGDYGSLVRTESLVLTDDTLNKAYRSESGITNASISKELPYLSHDVAPQWNSDYPQGFTDLMPIKTSIDPTRPGLKITQLGYGYSAGDTEYENGYFSATQRRKYDFHDISNGSSHGLPKMNRDPLGRDTYIVYDIFGLLPTEVVDPANLTIRAINNYRVLKPSDITESNGNRTHYTFTPLGFLEGISIMGKDNENVGDTIDKPSAHFEYNLNAFLEEGYLFNWDSISPTDNDDNTNALFDFLKRNSIIDKEIDNKQITFTRNITDSNTLNIIARGNNLLSIRLNTEQTNATLMTTSNSHAYGKKTYQFVIKKESGGKQNAYTQIQPIFVHTTKRIHHINETDVPAPELSDTTEIVEYSDGFGRLAQTRMQAEDIIFGDAIAGDAGLPPDKLAPDLGGAVGQEHLNDEYSPRVVVSGWQAYNNKGRIVEKYEPFFSQGWQYAVPEDYQRGQKATIYYDPRLQMVRTINPDNSEQCVIYGIPTGDLTNPGLFTPTPWEVYAYDSNDNAGRTHPTSSVDYQNHWNTPVSIVLDALGRRTVTIERKGSNPSTDWYSTRSSYDISGNLLTVTDARGRLSFQHVYDLLSQGHVLRIEQLDAGVRLNILDAAGNTVEERDSKGALMLHVYDILNRSIRLWARDRIAEPNTLREILVYGDDEAGSGMTHRQAAELNLLGKIYKHYDESGLIAFISDPAVSDSKPYDFKGNVLEKVRQVVSDEVVLNVFNSNTVKDWQVSPLRVDWQPCDNGETALDSRGSELLDTKKVYRTSSRYDALNRIKSRFYPQDVNKTRKGLYLRYNRAGGLENVKIDDVTYVEHIAYNAKGQRTFIVYGNNVITRYAYDQKTFRLARMRTENYITRHTITPSSIIYYPSGETFQDFAYKYDLVGNILSIHDNIFGNGTQNTRADELHRTFVYDPLYRLLSATGREQKYDFLQSSPPWSDELRPVDTKMTRGYREQYQYDAVGNLNKLQHQAEDDNGGFNRDFGIVPNSNRLAALSTGRTSYNYVYDPNGNLIQESSSRHFEWDHGDHMRVFKVQPNNAEPSIYAQYLYDSSGQQVKKLVRKQGGQHVEVTVYFDNMFEHHYIIHGNDTTENNILHVMDGKKRIALVRVGNSFTDDTTPAVKYHIGDHLDSSTVVVDDTGKLISREEYTPLGETIFGSFAKKRFRFTGKERDNESSLYYHHSRYYAPWLGRWMSCDPAFLNLNSKSAHTINPYAYVENRLNVASDPDGNELILAAVGAAAGLLIGGGIDAGRQLWTNKGFQNFKPRSVAAAAAGGAVAGGTFGLTNGGSLLFQATAAGFSGYFGGATTRAIMGEKWSLSGSVQDFAFGAIAFGMTAGATSAVLRSVAKEVSAEGAGIWTPKGAAVQEGSASSLAAKVRVESGEPLYRIGTTGKEYTWGEAIKIAGDLRISPKGGASGEYWSLENPMTTPGFAEIHGLPETGDGYPWIMKGIKKPGEPFITRPSPGIGVNPGGAPEAVTNPGSVRIEWFHMP